MSLWFSPCWCVCQKKTKKKNSSAAELLFFFFVPYTPPPNFNLSQQTLLSFSSCQDHNPVLLIQFPHQLSQQHHFLLFVDPYPLSSSTIQSSNKWQFHNWGCNNRYGFIHRLNDYDMMYQCNTWQKKDAFL